MTISVIKLSTQSLTLVVPSEHLEEFKKMIRRAFNCWPDASPDLKEFADRVIHDKPLQDYWAQDFRKKIIKQDESED